MYSPFDPKCKRGLAENDENAIVCCNVLLRIADKLHVRRSIKSLVTTVLGKKNETVQNCMQLSACVMHGFAGHVLFMFENKHWMCVYISENGVVFKNG